MAPSVLCKGPSISVRTQSFLSSVYFYSESMVKHFLDINYSFVMFRSQYLTCPQIQVGGFIPSWVSFFDHLTVFKT